jgi:hypothetical protein
LEDECEMLREMQSFIKTEKSFIEDLKEGFRLQFKENFAAKDGKIKELEERNDFICKVNEELRVGMRKDVEDAPTKEGIISMMKESIKDKNKEISDLKNDKKQMERSNLFICKENEHLRVDMRKLVEASYNKDSSVLMMEKTIQDKNMEISKLELEKDDNKQMLASTILKKNKALATNETIIH